MRPDMQGHLAMLVFSALVAGSFSLGALSANLISPTALNAARFVIAGMVIAVAVAATTGVPKGATRAPWRYLVLGGLFAVYFVLMFEGLKTARPVSAAAVFTLTPVIAAGFGWLLLRQVTTGRMALALAIGAVGALWVIFRADLAALRRFELGVWRSGVFPRLRKPCALYADGAQAEPRRAGGGVHLGHADRRWCVAVYLWLARCAGDGLDRAARDCLDHHPLRRDRCFCRDFCVAAIRVPAAAVGQGDGLYLSLIHI